MKSKKSLLLACLFLLCSLQKATASCGSAYVPNGGSNNVSIINTATQAVSATVAVGTTPFSVAMTPACQSQGYAGKKKKKKGPRPSHHPRPAPTRTPKYKDR